MSLSKINGINISDINTELLLHLNGIDGATSTTDESKNNYLVTFYDNAQIDTSQKKFGVSSLLLDGISDYIYLPASTSFYFDTEDFTIDLWARFTAFDVMNGLISKCIDGGNGGWTLTVWANTKNIAFAWNGGHTGRMLYYNGWSPLVDTWYHIAIVRNGNMIYMYINGVQVKSAVIDVAINSISTPIRIGHGRSWTGSSQWYGGYYMSGWLDEVRISNTALWTENFTPPTSETILEKISKFSGNSLVDISKILGVTK